MDHVEGSVPRNHPPPCQEGERTATNKLCTFGKGLVAQYVLDELVGDKVQMSHSGGLELGGADVRRRHVRIAELHLFVRHDVVQMLGDAFHDSKLRFRFGEVLQPVAVGPRRKLQHEHRARQSPGARPDRHGLRQTDSLDDGDDDRHT